MSRQRRILLVDDDPAMRSSLAEQLLLHEEFVAEEADTAATGLALARGSHYDCIIIDVGLPDMDGRDLCRVLRRQGVSVPVIMLIDEDVDGDQILSLEAGVNDYVTRPFRLGSLLARIRAQLRHYEQSEDAIFMIGPYAFRPAAKTLVDEARQLTVRLTEKEAAILKYLYRVGSQVVGRDTLLGEVWGYNASVTTHTLETHVYRLRQKIESDPSKAEILLTEPGGYRLAP